MKRKKKGNLIKHPLYLFEGVVLSVLFGVPTIMMNLQAYVGYPEYIDTIVGLFVGGIFAPGSLILFLVKFNRFLKREEKTRVEKIKRNAFTGKTFVLIRKRSVFANLGFLLGCLFIFIFWVLLFPVGKASGYGFWIARIISVFVAILGWIFSFITPLKMLTYQNGKLTIKTHERTLTISPSELIDLNKQPQKPKDKNLNKRMLYVDVILNLESEEIVLKSADCDTFLKAVIKAVKEIDEKMKNS